MRASYSVKLFEASKSKRIDSSILSLEGVIKTILIPESAGPADPFVRSLYPDVVIHSAHSSNGLGAAHNPEIARFGINDIKNDVDSGWSYGNRRSLEADCDPWLKELAEYFTEPRGHYRRILEFNAYGETTKLGGASPKGESCEESDILCQEANIAGDEFRWYEFKVHRCARDRSHDWTGCPYAHPGDKAIRRDRSKFHYSGTACPDFRKGYYSATPDQLHLAPQLSPRSYSHLLFESPPSYDGSPL
ncbi:hypothetical protein GIB67_022882 [Kingdonia uniflora]|uniref:AtC3H23-like CCCH zinc finger domain-containing protein n=1 Tax=Kingdonia uniflora TaxID=39325 RepID=A0A7J7MWE5_9MAGN|nr:hypothetical protein GIB67_022882 [Kingdonia uniflora]